MTSDMFGQFTQQASQQGISGEAGLDCRSQEGLIRIKLFWNPPERAAELTRGFADVLSTVLGMMNVEVKINIE